MDKRAIFIGGIHGVGKTTLCEELTMKMNIKHYSASSLIKMLNQEYDGNNQDKKVQNISDNQNLLMLAINQYIDQTAFYFLDGHFCLLDSKSTISMIPKEIFESIKPIGIIVLHDSIRNISKRITNRDRVEYDNNLLFSFQESEIEYSGYIANALQIPHMSFNMSNDIQIIIDFVTNLIERKSI